MERLCNPLLPQFSIDCFQTVNTLCGHHENVHVAFLIKIKLILSKLRPFEVSQFVSQRIFMLGYRICVINFYHNFQWIVFKLCIFVVDMMKDVHVTFVGDENKFNSITTF